MTTAESLNAPLALPCGQVLRNRLMKAALSEGLATSAHLPGGRLESLYRRWASHEFGLIVTGNVMVDRRQLGEPGNVVLEAGSDLDPFRRWSKAVHDEGAPIWMQINHPGRQANALASREKPVAPSAVKMDIPGLPAPRELTVDEIADVIGRFAVTAARAEEAEFDGVQIHAAHGYLAAQFLSPLSNRRTDEWGGDIDGRSRFLLSVVRAVRQAVSPTFAVGVKLNSADFQRGGLTEDDARAVVRMLSSEGVDLIEISGGSYESAAMMGRPAVAESTRSREAYFLDFAVNARAAAGAVPLAVTGGFRTRAGMTEAVASGACDVVGIGRPSAVNPAAAQYILRETADALPSRALTLPVPGRLRSASTVRALEGALDLQWHTDQLHRMGDGVDPDPDRSPWRTLVTTLRRNGFDALGTRRGAYSADATDRQVRKFRRERLVGRYVANPAVRGLAAVGVTTRLATELETLGRKSGVARRVPVTASFDETGAWIISQHGRRSGWALNVDSNPTVRIRQDGRWRTGVASFEPDDDVVARAKAQMDHPALAWLSAATYQALQTDPISVRITFSDKADRV